MYDRVFLCSSSIALMRSVSSLIFQTQQQQRLGYVPLAHWKAGIQKFSHTVWMCAMWLSLADTLRW